MVLGGGLLVALGLGLVPLVAWPAGVDSHIRTLAASCAACHGYEGKSLGAIPSLAGLSQDQFLASMQHYRDMPDDGSVMNQHAKGLTWEEIEGLAHYFSGLGHVDDPTANPKASSQ